MKIPFLNTVIAWSLKKRKHQIDFFIKYPVEVQYELLNKMIFTAKDTEIGKKFNFDKIHSYNEFAKQVPIRKYESIQKEIERARKGEQNIFWPTKIKWFAKSSGTTASKSKFIPVSTEALYDCHYKGVKDMLSIYVCNNDDTQMFAGKSLRLGGSSKTYQKNETIYGDLSAIIIQNLPLWAEFSSAPSKEVALMSDWETKMDRIIDETINEDITSLAGVPSWMLILLNKIIDRSGKDNILQVWPNLEVYFHGGVNFGPYQKQYEKLIPKKDFKYYETYNASEGFFAIQDQNYNKELLLMLDYGIFYEFIPMDLFNDEDSVAIPLEQVEINKNYAIVITTNAGLWRYLIGDTVQFTSLKPYRIKITGRTKYFINAFGEEIILDNVEKALDLTTKKTNSTIKEYTVAPIFMQENKKGKHQWLIEFIKEPEDLAFFTVVLDNALKAINSDYEAKRYLNITLDLPEIVKGKKDVFYRWLKYKNKLGGQHKIPRLSNDRKFMDEILRINVF
jgi:hypothetical protein